MSIFNKIKTNKIIINNPPTSNNEGVNKEYADINSINVISSVRLKTVALLSYTGSNPLTSVANESLVIDGVSCDVNDRILVDSNGTTSDIHNGIYEVTDNGGANQWVLTRTSDADENSELNKNSYVFVNEGDICADTSWITQSDVDIGVSSIIWEQFSSAISGSMKTSTGIIDIDNTTPSIDQILTATSATVATWQTGISDLKTSTGTISINSTTPTIGQTLVSTSGSVATWQTISGGTLTAVNVGSGDGVFKDKTSTLNFKSLLDDGVITTVAGIDDITIGLNQTSITSVGTLSSGSIVSGFGNIEVPEVKVSTLKLTDDPHNLILDSSSSLTADKTLTFNINDENRTIELNGNLTLGNNLTFTQTGVTNVTLPLTGTLSTLAGEESLTNKTLSGSAATITTLTTSTVQKGLANELKLENLCVNDSTVTLKADTGVSVGQFQFNDLDNSNFVSLKAEDTLVSNTTYILPSTYPSVNGRVLGSNTSGNLGWYPRFPRWAESTNYVTDDVVIGQYLNELRFFIALQTFTSGTGVFPSSQNIFFPPGTPSGSDYWQEISPFRGSLEGPLSFQSTLTPTTLSTTQTDYDPVDAISGGDLYNSNFLRLSSTTNVSINGLKVPDTTRNQAIFICNVGNSNITIKNESGLGDPENRFLVGGDRTLQGDEGIMLIYDTITLRWRSQAINI